MSWEGVWPRGQTTGPRWGQPRPPLIPQIRPPPDVPRAACLSLAGLSWPLLARPIVQLPLGSIGITQPPALKRPVAGPAGAGCPFSARLFLPVGLPLWGFALRVVQHPRGRGLWTLLWLDHCPPPTRHPPHTLSRAAEAAEKSDPGRDGLDSGPLGFSQESSFYRSSQLMSPASEVSPEPSSWPPGLLQTSRVNPAQAFSPSGNTD